MAPMRKAARTFRDHQPPILNRFAWEKEFSFAAAEGLDNKALVAPDDPTASASSPCCKRPCIIRSANRPNRKSPADSAEEA